MKEFRYTGQFKKDLKRFRNQPKKLAALHAVLEILKKGEELPPQYNPHQLINDYAGCMECHIGSDYLLVWFDETNDTIALVRLGSHSEIFKK